MFRKSSLLLAALLGLGSAMSASAATISWGTPEAVNINDPTQVLNSGTLILATSNANGSYTVNGVTFVNNQGGYLQGTTGGYNSFGPQTTDYSKMDEGGNINDSGGTVTATFGGLTSGTAYDVEVWTPFWNQDFPTTFISGANSVVMGNTGDVPTFVVGTFTADGTTQSFQYTASSVVPTDTGALGAFEVQTAPVPEPASLGLIAMGSLALLRRQRKA